MKVTSGATVFQVSDLPGALGFYRDVLGFEQEFIYGQPPRYASAQRNDISIHLSLGSGADQTSRLGRGSAYMFCDEVDACYHEVVQRGASVTSSLSTQHYGMRDFQIKDPDGNLIGFGVPTG